MLARKSHVSRFHRQPAKIGIHLRNSQMICAQSCLKRCQNRLEQLLRRVKLTGHVVVGRQIVSHHGNPHVVSGRLSFQKLDRLFIEFFGAAVPAPAFVRSGEITESDRSLRILLKPRMLFIKFDRIPQNFFGRVIVTLPD